ncbi:MAG: hypothetical protein NZ519_05795 [Bacteroidia bacterium]|nr:hypothetical protein [Bacteroidia bacterium]MDW8302021.1 hypothetical protein [Bacteroidia bacterium]
MPKKLKNITKARIHKDLKDFDIRINEFGEVSHTLDIDEINSFLNRNVQDKKLIEHPDFAEIQRKIS